MVQYSCGDIHCYAVDSCPVIAARRSYSAGTKVGAGFCDKCYNAAWQEWYYDEEKDALERASARGILESGLDIKSIENSPRNAGRHSEQKSEPDSVTNATMPLGRSGIMA